MVAVEESLDVKKAGVKRLEREFATKKKKATVTDRTREISQVASRPLAPGDEFITGLPGKVCLFDNRDERLIRPTD